MDDKKIERTERFAAIALQALLTKKESIPIGRAEKIHEMRTIQGICDTAWTIGQIMAEKAPHYVED